MTTSNEDSSKKIVDQLDDVAESHENAVPIPEYDNEDDLLDALRLAEQKAKENWDKFLMARADMDNARRRAELDLANAHKFALERFIRELLPVVDGLEQAILASEQVTEGAIPVVEGVKLTLKILLDTLVKFKVEMVGEIGQKFDPTHHEALSIQEDPTVSPNTVLLVVQKGYLLNERLIRPARVIVSK